MEPDPEYYADDGDGPARWRCVTCNRVLADPRAGSYCEGFYCDKKELA